MTTMPPQPSQKRAPQLAAAQGEAAPRANMAPDVMPNLMQPDEDVQMTDTRPKTSGDRFYDVVQFLTGKLFILGVTAALAFTAHKEYGPEKIGPFKNRLKQFQGYVENKLAPLKEWGMKNGKEVNPGKRDWGILLAEGTAGTLILSHGGNFFAPVIKWLENSRGNITNWYNKRFGTEEEVKITEEKFKDMPKQNWADVGKGRVMAWATVFAALTGAFKTFGRSKSDNHHFKLEWYEDAFARQFTRIHKPSSEIAKVGMDKVLNEAQKRNKVYRFGRVLALDLFATTTAIIVWNTVSRLSAKKRVAAENGVHHDAQAPAALPSPDPDNTQETQAGKFTDKIQPQQNGKEVLQSKKPDGSFAHSVSEQRRVAEQNPAHSVSTS